VARCAASTFIAPKTCFALLTTTLGFLELYITKQKAFFFLVAKTRWNQLYSIKSIFWFVCFVFCQFLASHADFYLILLKRTFSFVLG